MIRRIGIIVVGTALLAAAMWLKQVEPRARSHDTQPLRNSGRIGQSLSNSAFSIRVERVELARSLAPPLGVTTQPNIGTDGIFVIVHLQAKAAKEPFLMDQVRLESGAYTFTDNGRTYALNTAEGTYQPMIWRKALAGFEIPRNRLAGARLVVGQGGLLTQLSPETEVDLGITPGKAADMMAHAVDGYAARGGQ
ncbi:hypothetical protein ACRYCC_08795 [Actinomadura scrupuli]|uniref:hypothetical protein n=1 Tax=Actinomadura scrupuli TaxID=559629 RepID=UPI003D96D465